MRALQIGIHSSGFSMGELIGLIVFVCLSEYIHSIEMSSIFTFLKAINRFSIIGETLFTTAWRILGLRTEGRPPTSVQRSCECGNEHSGPMKRWVSIE
jgi:hypothetical protein